MAEGAFSGIHHSSFVIHHWRLAANLSARRVLPVAIAQSESRAAGPRVKSELLDRLPPQNLDAEKAVLGSLLLDPDMCDDVALVVRPRDFYAHANQVLFGHLLAMHENGVRVDITLLVERLKQLGDFETIGGGLYLAEVAQSVPTAANACYYANIVRDKATLRALIHASTEILRDAYDQSLDSREMLSSAEEKVFRILEEKGIGEIASAQDVLSAALSRIDARLTHGGLSGCVETGFKELDSLTGGLNASELVIIAGRPSMGKTALATNIATNVALDQKQPALFVSLEMSRLELGERLLCSHGRINGRKLREGFASAADQQKLVQAYSELSQARLYIDDSPSRTMTEIAATARRLKRREQLSLVVIDYLQLIEPDNPKDTRQEQVARIARRLKGLARELKIPVLCLAQLNRQAEMSKDNRPRLSHLRESGAIEQDADVVLFVHREEYYMTSDEDRERVTGKADIIVAKQRNGPTGDVKVDWKQEFTRFDDPTAEYLSDNEQFRPF
ncbi:MAG: replicative DNA helicase [Planctomycetia bacterium]|nr:replicative DNA helicase [Planctomycetia bacterium]